MCEEGYINDYGKLETSGGRYPSLYGLNPESGYFIGVDIKKFAINIGLINFKGDMVELKMNIPFKSENTSQDQMEKKLKNGVEGEDLRLLVGSIPYDNKISEGIKLNILKILNDKYGITEVDLTISETGELSFSENKWNSNYGVSVLFVTATVGSGEETIYSDKK